MFIIDVHNIHESCHEVRFAYDADDILDIFDEMTDDETMTITEKQA